MRDTGFELAEAMGLKVVRHIDDGEDGSVYLLDDKRILKITNFKDEAATSLALLDINREGRSHPSVPIVSDVLWLHDPEMPEEVNYYAIVRADYRDIELDGHEEREWSKTVAMVYSAWLQGDQTDLLEKLSKHDSPFTAEVMQIFDGLYWIEDNLGVIVRDIRPSNLGVGPLGAVGMRDMSRAIVPEHLLNRVKRLDFPCAPDIVVTPEMAMLR